MRLLNLAGGEFQVYSWGRDRYHVIAKKCNGHYSARVILGEETLQQVIKAWTWCKYIAKLIK